MESISLPIAFSRIEEYAGVWAIEPTAARTFLRSLQAFNLGQHIAEHMAAPAPVKSFMRKEDFNGRSVAIINVLGTMMKQQSSMGGTSTIQLRRDIRQAAADEDVSAIMLVTESPGGTVSGTQALAGEVQRAKKAKPVFAFAEDLTASAAYWVASQADKMFAETDTTMVGSIGTLLTVYDVSEAASRDGVKTFVFATGPIKGAGTPGAPITEAQASYFQSTVDSLQVSFDAAVMKGRNIKAKELADVRTGGLFTASQAENYRLIDGVKSFEQAMQELVRATKGNRATAYVGGLPMLVS